MVATLRDVWRVHYAREGDGRPRWRAGAELPPVGERLQSPYDPEAHYSTKRQMEWSGYKVHVTETCDEDAAHLVTHVLTCPAMQPDMASTADIHRRLADKDLLPAEHFVDSAYVDAALLVGSRRDHGVSLEGPVRGVANRHTGAEQGFEQRDFTIDWEREQVTCPRGKTSVTWRAGRDEVGAPRIQAVFSRTDCGACAARELCTPAKDARRSVYFHPRPEYEALNAARARMHDPAWKRRYRVRAGVEGTLSQGVRAFGMRRSRYIGLAKTGLQQVCTAAAMNVSRAVRWLAGATARQDARDALRGPGPSRLNSPTVSQLHPDRGRLALPRRDQGPGHARDRRLEHGRPPPGRAGVRRLRMALQRRQPPPGLIQHSDRGVQYACKDYRAILAGTASGSP